MNSHGPAKSKITSNQLQSVNDKFQILARLHMTILQK